MQIQARTLRGVKSRRVDGGSNFHETFHRMNEGRGAERLRVLAESLPIVDTFIFVASLLCDFPLCFPFWFRRRPCPRVSRVLLVPPLSIVLLSQMHLRRFSRRNSWPRYPIFPSWFDFRIPRRGFSEIFGIQFATRLFFRDGESRKCDSTVDYTRKIALDSPFTDISAECMYSKCIGSRTHIRFLRGCHNVRHYRKRKRRTAILDHHWHVNDLAV